MNIVTLVILAAGVETGRNNDTSSTFVPVSVIAYIMAVGGTPVGPILAGPILARASYIKFYILGKFILLRRKILSKSICNYILYYLVW